MTTLRWQVVLLAAAVAVPSALTLIPAAAPNPPVEVPLPTDQLSVCPIGTSETTIFGRGDDSIRSAHLGEELQDSQAQLSISGQTAPVVLASKKRFAAGALTVVGSTSGWSRCLQQRTNGLIALAHPKQSDLLLINTDDTEAALDLTLYGPKGEVTEVGSRGIVLSPKSSRVIGISTLVPDEAPIGVSIQTTAGRVAAVARTWSAAAGDYTTVSAPGETQLLPGVPANAKTVKVIVTNPGSERANIDISALGTQTIALAGAQDLAVEPNTTISVDVSSTIGTDPASVQVTSDQPVAASLAVDAGADSALVSHTEPVQNGRVFVPGGGVLSLTNPSESEVTLTVTAKADEGADKPTEVTVGPGQTWTGPGVAGDLVSYDLVSQSPVIAAVTLSNPGFYVAPFQSLIEAQAANVALTYDPLLR